MVKFLSRIAVKILVYFLILALALSIGLIFKTTIPAILLAAVVLALVNTLLRPLFVLIALPFNLITFGIASIFANLLSLVIASAIVGGTMTSGFWAMLLISFVIMLVDDAVRVVRERQYKKQDGGDSPS